MLPIGPGPTQTPEKSGVPSGRRGGRASGTAPISAGLLAPPLPAGEVPALCLCWASAVCANTSAANAANCVRMS